MESFSKQSWKADGSSAAKAAPNSKQLTIKNFILNFFFFSFASLHTTLSRQNKCFQKIILFGNVIRLLILRVYPDRTVDALTTSLAKLVVFKEMEVYETGACAVLLLLNSLSKTITSIAAAARTYFFFCSFIYSSRASCTTRLPCAQLFCVHTHTNVACFFTCLRFTFSSSVCVCVCCLRASLYGGDKKKLKLSLSPSLAKYRRVRAVPFNTHTQIYY